MRRAALPDSPAVVDARVTGQLERYAGGQLARLLTTGTADNQGKVPGRSHAQNATQIEPSPADLAAAREFLGRIFQIQTPLGNPGNVKGDTAIAYVRRKMPEVTTDLAQVVVHRVQRKAKQLGADASLVEREWRRNPPLPVSDELTSSSGGNGSSVGNFGRQGNHDLCGCMAVEHPLAGNCLCCGRVICDQELIRPRGSHGGVSSIQKCPFCFVTLGDDGTGTGGADENNLEKATAHKNKLLDFARTSAKRTHIYDDQSDYYQADADRWSSPAEREAAEAEAVRRQEERELQKRQHSLSLGFGGDGTASAVAKSIEKPSIEEPSSKEEEEVVEQRAELTSDGHVHEFAPVVRPADVAFVAYKPQQQKSARRRKEKEEKKDGDGDNNNIIGGDSEHRVQHDLVHIA